MSITRQADRRGLDYLAVQDHPYQPGYLDVWTMLTYLLARTEQISVVPDVIDLQLRPPTILAKAAASLATMAGGRVGVGGGASANRTFRRAFPGTTGERVIKLRDRFDPDGVVHVHGSGVWVADPAVTDLPWPGVSA
jgi:alkanesulfonate monooxygenase SsuD/methylene tetrahydromethanopterin reductase-like flavin-dependent oxidoreductase (luciferase family)